MTFGKRTNQKQGRTFVINESKLSSLDSRTGSDLGTANVRAVCILWFVMPLAPLNTNSWVSTHPLTTQPTANKKARHSEPARLVEFQL